MQSAVTILGRLDIVVNNSGVARVAPLVEWTTDEWRIPAARRSSDSRIRRGWPFNGEPGIGGLIRDLPANRRRGLHHGVANGTLSARHVTSDLSFSRDHARDDGAVSRGGEMVVVHVVHTRLSGQARPGVDRRDTAARQLGQHQRALGNAGASCEGSKP